jgi:aspartyl protease family protein
MSCALTSGVAFAQQRKYMILDGQRYQADQIDEAVQSPYQAAEARCNAQECQLPRSPDGHFYIAGTVNGFPVVWMVDTGASHSAIPMNVARNAGIRVGVAVQMETAGGRAQGALSYGNVIGIGAMRIDGVQVSMSPKLGVALLGASALQRMYVSQSGDVLVIRRVR